jgi:hypothetical protein
MKRATFIILACSVALAQLALGGSPGGRTSGKGGLQKISSPTTSGDFTVFDVNRVKTFIRNNGSFDRDPGTGNSGYEWPKGSGNTAIYASGLWLGAKGNSDGIVRVAVAEYSYEYDAGPILAGGVPADPGDSRYRMYKIKRGDNASTNPDYANWPVADGAPVDALGNPLILGDMTVWCVFNEADPSVHVNMNAPPLGVEVQMTTFAFNRADALGDVLFFKWKIINKGGRNLDSTYVTVWTDADLGDSGDDYDGCDTTLGLGFTYNGDDNDGVYGIPPAVGFDFLQGPMANGAPTDTARFPDGRFYPGKKLLKMTSFIKYSNDATDLGNPSSGQEVLNYQKGLTRSGLQILDPAGNPSTFMFPGDPTQPYGTSNWIETDPPGDRRFMMSAGPFNLAAGDTQEIVAASLIAQATSAGTSVIALKQADALVQTAYDANFALPPPPDPPPVVATPSDQTIFLSWGDGIANASKAIEIEATETVDPIAEAGGAADFTYNFQGYVVYQVANPSGDDPRRIGTYDLVDGIKLIYDNVFDPNIGAIVNRPVKFGDDTGVKRTVQITTDKYTGQPLSNQKDYYYIVTAYSYNNESIPKTLESAGIVTTVRPTKLPGQRAASHFGDTLTVAHSAGAGDGSAQAFVVDPTKTTGHNYNIGFDYDSVNASYSWFARDMTTGRRVVTGQVNQTGDAAYPTFDGVQAVIVGPPNGMKEFSIPSGARRWTWVGADGFGLEGFNGAIGYGYGNWFSGSTIPASQVMDVLLKLAATDTSGNLLDPGDTTASLAYRYLRRAGDPPALPEFAPFILNPTAGQYAFQEFGRAGGPNVPFAAYNAVTGQRLMVGHLENNVAAGMVDGKYWPPYSNSGIDNVAGPREWWFVFNVPYSTTVDPSLAVDILSETLPLIWMGTPNRRGDNIAFQAGDEFLIVSNKVNTDADVFSFSAPAPASLTIENQKADINLINAVPNPYYGANAYERNQFNRVIRFTNLPRTTTIRIFNLLGDLVRTLRKDDANTSVDWNLQNENGLPVASGMFIAHVEVPGIGERVLKLAVILSQERLDNF